MSLIARLENSGVLKLNEEIHEVIPALNSEEQVDDTTNIDDSSLINDQSGIEEFFSLLFGINTELIEALEAQILSNGNIVTKEIVEGEHVRVGSDKRIEVTELREEMI